MGALRTWAQPSCTSESNWKLQVYSTNSYLRMRSMGRQAWKEDSVAKTQRCSPLTRAMWKPP